MIPYFTSNEKSKSQILRCFKELKVAQLLKQANITKLSSPHQGQVFSAYAIFSFLTSLVFQGMTLFRFMQSKYGKDLHSKNTYYRFMSEARYNWERFVLLLATQLIHKLDKLTHPNRVRVLIVDDTVISKKRSKKMELLARIYDHVEHRFDKGFSMLTLGWSDGFSFVPLAFNLLSSANKRNRYNEAKVTDGRTLAARRRQKSKMKKTEATVDLVKQALTQGIKANYLLMDTWFTAEPLIMEIKALGLDVIGMVKQLKQTYHYQGQTYTLPQLRRKAQLHPRNEVAGEVIVTTKKGVNVKIVFLRNRNKRSEFLSILSTDTSLSKEEIVRIYGHRWKIECFFKASKSFLRLGKEFQSPNYDNLVAQTTMVLTRYIMIEWLRRQEQDERTYGELFFCMSEEVQDLPFEEALRSLLSLFEQALTQLKNRNELFNQLTKWWAQQPAFIRGLAQIERWES